MGARIWGRGGGDGAGPSLSAASRLAVRQRLYEKKGPGEQGHAPPPPKGRGRGKAKGGRSEAYGRSKKATAAAVFAAGTDIACEQDGFRRHYRLPKAHGAAVTAICVASDAVYTASRDGTLKVWKPTPAPGGALELAPQTEVLLGDACWSMVHAGEWIFCGLAGGPIRAFSRSGQDTTLVAHTDGVSSMLVHQDVLVSGSAEGAVRCWQLDGQAGTFVNSHTVNDLIPGQVRCLAVMAGQLWVGGAAGVTVVELATLGRAAAVAPALKVNGLLEYQGHMIAAYADGSFCVFDGAGKERHRQLPLRAGPVVCMVGLESGPRVLCGHAKGELSSIALPAFEPRCIWYAFDGCQARSACSAQHEGIFILGSEEGELQVWQRSDAWVRHSAGGPGPEDLQAGIGAPRCASGHLCKLSPASEPKPGGDASWRCSVCGAKRATERWLCLACQESLCLRCFPRRGPEEREKKGIGEAVSVDGRWVHVRKHSGMGCAVVTFKDVRHRDTLLARFAAAPLVLGGIAVEVRPHMEKKSDGRQVEVPDCAFAGWKQPKEVGACKLIARTLQVYLDRLCDGCCPVICLDEDEL